jgi:hypothetical protein
VTGTLRFDANFFLARDLRSWKERDLEMRRMLSAAAAFGVCAVLGAASSHADTINPVDVFLNQNVTTSNTVSIDALARPDGTLIPGPGAQISFDLETPSPVSAPSGILPQPRRAGHPAPPTLQMPR